MTGTQDNRHILVVEDDRHIAALLEVYLTGAGYRVTLVESGDGMREVLREHPVDLIVMDLMLPGEDGFTLTRFLRERYRVGIIILTARKDTVDRIVGLEMGADDYVMKPFDERELLARIRSVLRRLNETGGQEADSATVPASVVVATASSAPGADGGRRVAHFTGWRVDLDQRRLFADDDSETTLTGSEFNLLSAFVSSPQRVLTRDHLLNVLHNRDWDTSDRSIDVLVNRLRRKLNDSDKPPNLIRTVRGIGYLFAADVSWG